MGLQTPLLIVIMGVSGCGKSTVGLQLAQYYHAVFLDADDFHPEANIQKMSGGTPLTDQDRKAWVAAMRKGVNKHTSQKVVLACSALTPMVQNGLAALHRRLVYVHLNTSRVDMKARLARRDHFMPVKLLESQYEALDVPKDALDVDASQPLPDLLTEIIETLSATALLSETQQNFDRAFQ